MTTYRELDASGMTAYLQSLGLSAEPQEGLKLEDLVRALQTWAATHPELQGSVGGFEVACNAYLGRSGQNAWTFVTSQARTLAAQFRSLSNTPQA